MSWQKRWMQPTATVEDLQLAVFTLGDLEYALDIMRISQIIQPQPIRPVPNSPEFVEGVIELRGSVVPIMDLRRRFGLHAPPLGRSGKFIIVRVKGRLVGAVVDRVIGVHRVPKDTIRPTPQWVVGSGSDMAVFSGVCRREDHLVLLVDLDLLLSSEEKINLSALSLDAAKDWPNEGHAAVSAEDEAGLEAGLEEWWESE